MFSYLTTIGTAVPRYRFEQSQICKFMQATLPLTETQHSRLPLLYRASGIQYRHSVIPDYGRTKGAYTFYPNEEGLKPFPRVRQRMEVYEREAVKLASEAVMSCLSSRHMEAAAVTHLVTVSCTGMYAPGLDIDLVKQLGLNSAVERTAINFMGCYGAFNGIKVADSICRSNTGAKVLVVCVELCTLHFQQKTDEDSLLSAALFSDGAAAVLVEGLPQGSHSLKLKATYADLFTDGEQDMAWRIGNHGFDMMLSAYVPDLVGEGITQLIDRLMTKAEVEWKDIRHFAIHPGGKRILEQIEKVMNLAKVQNQSAYEVLQNYGNMSSATVLFVLENLLKQRENLNSGENILSLAFGPGLTLESMLLEVC
ncbi:type III polyketide synthase [Limibacter armeniacum]|uniref:type III polyketide synthase n=1 Tax=Limibacter armeniacum TaxID=466084 RepID=UPI002FE5F8E5